uniref:Uncharacterized protein n=1 Tax=Anguilla anguilla TaxID=7936 RepID=A0A0E9SIW8_ANGAN
MGSWWSCHSPVFTPSLTPPFFFSGLRSISRGHKPKHSLSIVSECVSFLFILI